ncbi:hypothetical protein NLG97_g7837 [Lecanicillium saksenae]|uniref:Uncharacterized protein n=1 Tax=Lecanicillium saksenae TaxID=468837 RepID=A0ACC1QNX0_9HYPO|nr:hypothetical protein NLG97_g7837 [Lecanicillium saksenae]
MRYRDAPQGFKVTHWRHLYDAYISSSEQLRNLPDDAVYVVFDAEPWSGDNIKAAEIGISMLQTRYRDSVTQASTLAEVARHYAIETHRIQIIDMERQRTGEAHRFGQEHRVSSADVEQYILGLADSYKQRVSPLGEQIILVGFDLQFEFRLLSTVYIGLTNYFTSWIDVQELARLASSVDKPGLSQTLKVCGVGQEEPADLHSLTGRHNAATDTVRTAAILHHLLAIEDRWLEIATSQRNASMRARRRRAPPTNAPEERKIWSGTRPKPRELYPYTARVKLPVGNIPSATDLLQVFAEYDLVAVGTAKQGRYG